MHTISEALVLSQSTFPKAIIKKEKMSKKSKGKERVLVFHILYVSQFFLVL